MRPKKYPVFVKINSKLKVWKKCEWCEVCDGVIFLKMYFENEWNLFLRIAKCWWCFAAEGSNAFSCFSLNFPGWELANMHAEYSECQRQGVANAAPS